MVVRALQMSLHVDLVENLRAVRNTRSRVAIITAEAIKQSGRTSLMRWPGVVDRDQVQAVLLGYLSGQLGLLIVPDTLLRT